MKKNDIIDNSKLDQTDKARNIRLKIMELVQEYVEEVHGTKEFIPGKTLIPVSGKVFDYNEVQHLVSAGLDFWLTTGRFNHDFEQKLSKFLNIPFVLTTNSGSSANLIALSSLTSEKLGDRSIKNGDEVITVATCFPTTVNPILQNNLTPIFVDIDHSTFSVDVDLIEQSITEKTKAIMIAHLLGNPYDAYSISRIAKKNNLWLVEDCCDALGTTLRGKHVGTFGDIGTLSFYPAHQITMGEGGAVFTNNPELNRIMESFRDWGRDCFCAPGKNNTCGKRFNWNLGELPEGYDHKYTYSETGYNLKISDMQAAVGVAQIEKLQYFTQKRQEHFNFLKNRLKTVSDFIMLPESIPHAEPSWFGFPLIVKPSAPFTKNDLVNFLSSKLVDTRPLFAGNITKQPYFKNKKFRIFKTLDNTDYVMNNAFWIGTFPGLTLEILDYVVTQIEEFCIHKKETLGNAHESI
ncbi:MAG: lipopolysaccharide biosynthesis protein RfbH [Nitrosarchaeum sp.]|nr:lipopolysaccharide biosynthesis protein RfbH [Nitrosarchaeum sp.]